MSLPEMIAECIRIKPGNKEFALFFDGQNEWDAHIGNDSPMVMLGERSGEFNERADSPEQAVSALLDSLRGISEAAEALSQMSGVATWSGEGLPPVGAVCEWHGANHDGPNGWVYSESTVVGYSPCGLFVFMQKPSCWPVVERLDNCEFRPIRTPEQIAAEERDAAYRDMVDDLAKAIGISNIDIREAGVLHALVDAGYRKQEAP